MAEKKGPVELSYLPNGTSEHLPWTVEPGKTTIRKGVFANGTCFFHVALQAVSSVYRSRPGHEQVKWGVELRDQVTKEVTLKQFLDMRIEKRKVLEEKGFRRYLPRGGDGKSEKPSYSNEELFEAYKAYVRDSSNHVGAEVFELVSNAFDIDIYVFTSNGDYAFTPVPTTKCYKKRPSILVLYLSRHYELLGILREDGTGADYFFLPENPIIKKLHKMQSDAWDLYRRTEVE